MGGNECSNDKNKCGYDGGQSFHFKQWKKEFIFMDTAVFFFDF